MSGQPASIAPEPNNYEFISSRGIFFLVASSLAGDSRLFLRSACLLLHIEKLRRQKETQKRLYLVFHVSLASVIVVFIYSGGVLLLIVCQSPAQKRKADCSPPLPDATKTESSLSQSQSAEFNRC